MNRPRQPADPQVRRRFLTVALATLGAALMIGSYFLPWWQFHLKAPQYPQGLVLLVSLTGITGDVGEIDIINHYIGMSHLSEGAAFERAWGGWLLGVLVVLIVASTLLAGRQIGWIAGAIGLSLPVGFIADTQYWLWKFGHDLDPKAPVHIAPFTPTMFGEGKVGQFVTTATPSLGFALAVAGVALVGLAVWQRSKVCRVCPASESCTLACPVALVGVRP